jgi:hypothetical protein
MSLSRPYTTGYMYSVKTLQDPIYQQDTWTEISVGVAGPSPPRVLDKAGKMSLNFAGYNQLLIISNNFGWFD